MANPTETPTKQMTAAEAARAVKRTVVETVIDEKTKEKKLVTKKVSVSAGEVLSFKDYGSHVVVCTIDGQKLSSAEA